MFFIVFTKAKLKIINELKKVIKKKVSECPVQRPCKP
jgi:hypothetical protein